jgi:hypothetical protein
VCLPDLLCSRERADAVLYRSWSGSGPLVLPCGGGATPPQAALASDFAVIVEERAHVMRPEGNQEGERESTTDEVPKDLDDIKPERLNGSGAGLWPSWTPKRPPPRSAHGWWPRCLPGWRTPPRGWSRSTARRSGAPGPRDGKAPHLLLAICGARAGPSKTWHEGPLLDRRSSWGAVALTST